MKEGKKMKKLISILLALCLLTCVAACSPSTPDEPDVTQPPVDVTDPVNVSNKLTVYSSESDEVLNLVVPAFEKATDIKVDIISAKTGELMKRIESEGANPQADLLLGSNSATLSGLKEYFSDYTSVNDAAMSEGFTNDSGCFTPYKADGSVIIVNKSLLADLGIEVKGYADLLQPELKGKIAMADSATSSSAREHLLNILVDFADGDNESDEGWDYVKALLENAEGKILESSGAIYKGVADGEYAVGLSYENPCLTLVRDGADVEVIYMEEGTVFAAATVQILNNCQNPDNAKKFVDFVTSEEIQSRLGMEACVRPLRANVAVADYMTPLEDIVQRTVNRDWAAENKDYLAETFTDMVTDLG